MTSVVGKWCMFCSDGDVMVVYSLKYEIFLYRKELSSYVYFSFACKRCGISLYYSYIDPFWLSVLFPLRPAYSHMHVLYSIYVEHMWMCLCCALLHLYAL
jgi:hypothetical protein